MGHARAHTEIVRMRIMEIVIVFAAFFIFVPPSLLSAWIAARLFEFLLNNPDNINDI